MSKNTKADFKNLLNRVSEKKEKEVPIQKVVPVDTIAEGKPATEVEDLVKISLSLYLEDWLDITKFRNYKVVELKNLDFTIASTISYGLSLLEQKYDVARGKQKFALDRGRRNGKKRVVKTSSVDLPLEKVSFINDFLHFKVFEKQQLKYTRPEMFEEMVQLIKAENPSIFELES